MESIEPIIRRLFIESLQQQDQPVPDAFDPDLVLLQSGLDSLGFAILVTRLEMELEYDPFTIMEEAVYPSTYGEFVNIYERYRPRS